MRICLQMIDIAQIFTSRVLELYRNAQNCRDSISKTVDYELAFKTALRELPRKLTREETDRVMDSLEAVKKEIYQD